MSVCVFKFGLRLDSYRSILKPIKNKTLRGYLMYLRTESHWNHTGTESTNSITWITYHCTSHVDYHYHPIAIHNDLYIQSTAPQNSRVTCVNNMIEID